MLTKGERANKNVITCSQQAAQEMWHATVTVPAFHGVLGGELGEILHFFFGGGVGGWVIFLKGNLDGNRCSSVLCGLVFG